MRALGRAARSALVAVGQPRTAGPRWLGGSRRMLSVEASGADLGGTSRKVKGGGGSSGAKVPPPPEDFFNEDVEKEKEFLDVASALALEGGLENLTTTNDPFTWDEIDTASENPSIHLSGSEKAVEQLESKGEAEMEEFEGTGAYKIVTEALSNNDLAAHLSEIQPRTMVPEEYLNYSVPWRKTDVFPHEMLDRFVPRTSKELYRHDAEGERACAGKMQRKGASGELRCHILDLDQLNHLDVLTLRRFIADDGEILGKKQTGLCSKCQRVVATTIKRSRNLGILPHLSEFVMHDSKPLQKAGSPYHDVAPTGEKHVVSVDLLR